jgi:hypothetical protein
MRRLWLRLLQSVSHLKQATDQQKALAAKWSIKCQVMVFSKQQIIQYVFCTWMVNTVFDTTAHGKKYSAVGPQSLICNSKTEKFWKPKFFTYASQDAGVRPPFVSALLPVTYTVAFLLFRDSGCNCTLKMSTRINDTPLGNS